MSNLSRRLIALSAVAFGLWGLACGSARYIAVDGNGGVIGMPGNTESSREKAVKMMSDKCPGGYLIDREEEAQIGTVTSSSQNYGRYSTNGTQTTEAKTEWRITFHCK
jgi:hypothetical protein